MGETWGSEVDEIMKWTFIAALPLSLALVCGYGADGGRVAPQGNWRAREITGNSTVCTFPWIMEAEYLDGKVTYTGPQVQSKPFIITFLDIHTKAPRVVARDVVGSREDQGFQGFEASGKISLVKISPNEKNVFTYTLHLQQGVATMTEEVVAPCGGGPRVRMAMGTCE
jgi:hypothetical protein